MSGDFESILDRSADEITEPKPYPSGTWLLKIANVARKQDDDGREIVNFALVGLEPQDDVDSEALAEAGDDYQGQKIWKRFTIENKGDAFQLKRFLETFGVETKGKSLVEATNDSKGAVAFGYVGVRTYTDKNDNLRVDNTVKQFAPAA